MKYYAVTDDPNELIHWGIKGMKWGVRRTDAQLGHPRHTGSKRPRSAAYKRAQSKLSAAMRNGIKAVEKKWEKYNSPEMKAERAFKKSEKKFEQHLEKARKGTLKYKGISDYEVARITDRLNLERQSRALSGAEKPSYLRRLREAAGEGIVTGVSRGTAAYMEARWRGRGETTAAIKKDKRMAKYESDKSVQRRKAKNKANEQYYEEAAKRGVLTPFGYQKGVYTNAARARQMQAWNARDAEEKERAARQRSLHEAYDRTYAAKRAEYNIGVRNTKQNALYGRKNNSSNNYDNSNNGNKGNGQAKQQLPVSINIYGNNGAKTTTGGSKDIIVRGTRRKRKGRR